MNIHFEQAEKKSQVFFYMLVVVVVVTVCMLISNTSQTVNLHLSIPSSVHPAHGEISKVPVAVPAPLPSTNEVLMAGTPVPSSTLSPLPQAVPAPVPDLP